MAHYSIKDLERLSGIKAHTIRIWEKRYNLINPARTDTNIRRYSDTDLKKILNVSILNRSGIKISRIAAMEESEITEKILIVSRDSSEYDNLIENLVITMMDLDDERFEIMLSRAIMQIGFEETILKIVYPFLERIGFLWQTGAINPVQEHFISNLVRQKMIVAVDSVIPSKHPDPKHFVLFLPEGELHELGLLFYNYLLLKRGHKVTYLGQWVPMQDMAAAISVINADYLLTSIVTIHSGEKLNKYLAELSSTFEDLTIFVTGYQIAGLNDSVPENILRLKRTDELFSHID